MADLQVKEHESVILTEDVPEEGLKAGDRGVVVMVHRHGEDGYTGPDGYTVEFTAEGEHTFANLYPHQVKPVRANQAPRPMPA